MAEKQGSNLDNVPLAFVLVIGAGLSTALGATAVFNSRIVSLASKPVLAAALGLSCGVQLYISTIDIFVKSREEFEAAGQRTGDAYYSATICLFAGMLLLKLINALAHLLDPDHEGDFEGSEAAEAPKTSSSGILPAATDMECPAPPPQLATPPDSLEALEELVAAPPCQRAGSAKARAPGFGGSLLSCLFPCPAPVLQAPPPGRVEPLRPSKPSPMLAIAVCKQPSGPGPAEVAAAAPSAAAAAAAQEGRKTAAENAQLQRMGLKTAAAIAIHNFPEGLATFVATLADPTLGATLAIAVTIHNVPEGLCVALPIYYATGSRVKGFLWALLSGMSEPVGAFVGWLIVRATGEDLNKTAYAVLFGLVTGMMIMIVISELLPTAFKYDPADKFVTNSVVCGMLLMATSLCIFKA